MTVLNASGGDGKLHVNGRTHDNDPRLRPSKLARFIRKKRGTRENFDLASHPSWAGLAIARARWCNLALCAADRVGCMLVADHLRPASVEAAVLKEGETVRFGSIICAIRWRRLWCKLGRTQRRSKACCGTPTCTPRCSFTRIVGTRTG